MVLSFQAFDYFQRKLLDNIIDVAGQLQTP